MYMFAAFAQLLASYKYKNIITHYWARRYFY